MIGVGDQHSDQLPETARRALADYIQIGSWGDEDAVIRTVLDALRGRNIDLVETLWEPTVVLAARLREAMGAPGTTVEQAVTFRDKGLMKDVLARAGIRIPYAFRSTTVAGVREAAEQIGFPLIVKPISGAGSLDTYRVADRASSTPPSHVFATSMRSVWRSSSTARNSPTTPSAPDGTIAFFNICEYRPRPLVGKQVEWISQQVIAHRDVDAPQLAGGRAMGEAVIAAWASTAGSRTWSGIARGTARSFLARSGRGRRAVG